MLYSTKLSACILAFLIVLAYVTIRPAETKQPVSPPSFIEISPYLDSLASTSTYYRIRNDLRRCVSPLCGGYFVKRVNRPSTLCANGRYAAECYVAEIDWQGQPAVDAKHALLRGTLERKQYEKFGQLGVLRVTEVWKSASDHPALGVIYRVKDNGVRCITQPCLTYHEAELNSTVSSNIAGVDLSGVGVNDNVSTQAQSAMSSDGILVAGSHTWLKGPAGHAKSLKASQFYLRASGKVSQKPCIKTGCSNQICAEEEVVSTCEFRPEYACYQKARCERQPDGNCGFTKTPELTACLNRK